MIPDSELLKDYALSGSESAFRALVERHFGLVYSTARRRLGGDAHLAHDVTQAVFTDLARKSRQLSARSTLAGWLFTSALYAAAKAMRSERRRARYEQEAQTMNELNSPEPSTLRWDQISPLIDGALHELPEDDREAVILRFFEQQSFGMIGEQLAVNDDTARARVQRALEKLRGKLERRGITSTAEALAMALGAGAVRAVPVDAAASVATAALTAAKAGGIVTVGTSFYTLMSTSKTIAASAALLAMATAYLATVAWRQHVTLEGWANERSAAAHERATMEELREQNRALKREVAELSRANAAAAVPPVKQLENEKLEDGLDGWLRRISNLKSFAAANPDKTIPEMRTLTVEDWLYATKDRTLETEADYRQLLAQLRATARMHVSKAINSALTKYLEANGGVPPGNAQQLASYLDAATDPAILANYVVYPDGVVPDMPGSPKLTGNKPAVLAQYGLTAVSKEGIIFGSARIDPVWDSGTLFSNKGVVISMGVSNQVAEMVTSAAAKYRQQMGSEPTDFSQLLPYVDTSKIASAKLSDAFTALHTKPKLKE
jgi:RNA polymerase sigma factor (sigma-70 family)